MTPHQLTKDLDVYDSDCDGISSAKAVWMANLSSCDSDVLFEVPYSDTYSNDMINQDVQEMSYSEQSHIVDFLDNEITSDSNIIPYSQYLQESQYEQEIDTLKQTLSNYVKEKESLSTTLTIFKTEAKEKESKYIDKEIVLENQNKELENIIPLGYQTSFHLKKAQRIKPTLYDGSVIAKKHDVFSVIDDDEALILEEESRLKMLDKQNDPILIKQKIKISPIDYSKLNNMKEDFGKCFVTQQELSAEQAFWLKHLNSISKTPVKSHTSIRIKAPSELPKVSLVNESLKKLKYNLATFDKVVKKRTTSDAITVGAWGFEHTKACFLTEVIPFLKVLKDTFNAFDKTLLGEITEVQIVFNQIEATVDQCSVDKNSFKIQIKQLSIDNDQLLNQIMSQEIMHIVVNSVDILDVSKSCVDECNKCLVLKTELFKKKDLIEKDDNSHENHNAPRFNQLFEINELKAQSQEKDTFIRKLKDRIKSLSGKDSVENVKKDIDEIRTINIELEHSVAKLLSENENLRKEQEHLKSIYKDQFDSINKTRVQSKEHNDSLIAQMNAKSDENSDLNAQLQEKVFAIATLKNELRKLKEKNVVDTAVSTPIATTIAPGMFKLDIEPISHGLKNNRDAHEEFRKPKESRSVGSSSKVKIVGSKTSNTKEPKQSWGSTVFDVLSSSLIDCRFANDHIAKIMSYGDYQMGNVTISQVYYVEGLGHNLFSMVQFCNSDLEASKTKSWLWHQRLSHLNFDYITSLAKQGLIRGLLKLKYQKDHLCSACALGKSKKHSHKPKAEDFIQEKLYLLHMDLCGPMRIQSINGIKYILVIVDDYSRTLCYPTNDGEDIGKLKPKADIGIFVGYAPKKKSFQIYNKRTRLIIKIIHVDFDELTAMDFEQFSSGLGPKLLTPGTISSGLVQKYDFSWFKSKICKIPSYTPNNGHYTSCSATVDSPEVLTQLSRDSSEYDSLRTKLIMNMKERFIDIDGIADDISSLLMHVRSFKNCRKHREVLHKCNSLGYSALTARNLVIMLGMTRKPKWVRALYVYKENTVDCVNKLRRCSTSRQRNLTGSRQDVEIDEQELEAHYSYMAKIQEVPICDRHDAEPLEQQSESISNTCAVETGDSNVIPDSPDMCDNDIQNDQHDVECDDERAALANLIANLKLDVDDNKKIQKQLKKANATLTQELTECKSILAETSRTLGESNIDYDKLERKLNETLGLLAQKEIDIKEGLKVKAYEISVVKEKHDELVKQSLLTKSHYEGLVKEKTKVITDLKLKEEKDIDKMISMENQLKFLNEIVYKRSQSIQTIHMLAPKCLTFNGRPTFVNPMYLKKAQYEKPCLYAIPHDQSDPANRLVPDREETLTLEEESRSKLNKDLVKPFDYTKLNSLYEIFKPPTQHYEIQFAQANEIRKKMWRKSFVKTKPNIFKNIDFLPVSKSISKSRQAYNVMTNNINHLKEIVDQAWVKHSNDRLHLRNPTAQDMEILVKTCLMPLALKTQNDSFAFVHELKQEMHADLKYVESLKDEIDELESDKENQKSAIKSVATPQKKTSCIRNSTITSSKSYYRMLYKKTSKAWKWWIAQQCPSTYKWVPKTQKKWVPKIQKKWVPKVRNESVPKRVSFAVDNTSRITNVLKLTNTLGSNLSCVPSSSTSLADCTTHPIHFQGKHHDQKEFTSPKVSITTLFSVGQFCDTDWSCFQSIYSVLVRDLQGNDLLIGNGGSDLINIPSMKHLVISNYVFLLKPHPTQLWYMASKAFHLNFDYITAFSKKIL
ncbi:integrase, catalytic region, zinc finger, CCHC-type containing protein [Tanacetum coccineum]|uniref:Integrase, catalytic region, zinc finger, CCHC-type containing protein n=1 Tax=Tanacetum coccineum TaxID=301880 RepID=A0ABQ4Y4A9_9ASTR